MHLHEMLKMTAK